MNSLRNFDSKISYNHTYDAELRLNPDYMEKLNIPGVQCYGYLAYVEKNTWSELEQFINSLKTENSITPERRKDLELLNSFRKEDFSTKEKPYRTTPLFSTLDSSNINEEQMKNKLNQFKVKTPSSLRYPGASGWYSFVKQSLKDE